MKIIDSKDMVNIIRTALNYADERLMDHGARVAYLLLKLLELKGNYANDVMYSLYLVALLHDIGAYKTDEIDDMITFDTNKPWRHQIYGYLFLKNLSPLSEYAEIVKYHHVNYNKYHDGDSFCRDVALMIKLCDRIDCMNMLKKDREAILKSIKSASGTQFDPAHVGLFIEADDKYNLIQNIQDNGYTNENLEYLQETMAGDQIIELLSMIALSIDFHSQFTVLHTISVVKVSRLLAEKIGLDPKNVKKIEVGALLHDIGKIAIPIEILEKTTSLTDSEMEIMKSHVILSEQIIEKYIDPEICRIAVRHHEKLNGTGYPYHLTEPDLTIEEQIMAVTDIFSALHAPRSYKPPFSREFIVKELSSLAESNQLSKKIVNLCIENYSEFDAVLSEISRETTKMYESIQAEYTKTIYDFEQNRYFIK